MEDDDDGVEVCESETRANEGSSGDAEWVGGWRVSETPFLLPPPTPSCWSRYVLQPPLGIPKRPRPARQPFRIHLAWPGRYRPCARAGEEGSEAPERPGRKGNTPKSLTYPIGITKHKQPCTIPAADSSATFLADLTIVSTDTHLRVRHLQIIAVCPGGNL